MSSLDLYTKSLTKALENVTERVEFVSDNIGEFDT